MQLHRLAVDAAEGGGHAVHRQRHRGGAGAYVHRLDQEAHVRPHVTRLEEGLADTVGLLQLAHAPEVQAERPARGGEAPVAPGGVDLAVEVARLELVQQAAGPQEPAEVVDRDLVGRTGEGEALRQHRLALRQDLAGVALLDCLARTLVQRLGGRGHEAGEQAAGGRRQGVGDLLQLAGGRHGRARLLVLQHGIAYAARRLGRAAGVRHLLERLQGVVDGRRTARGGREVAQPAVVLDHFVQGAGRGGRLARVDRLDLPGPVHAAVDPPREQRGGAEHGARHARPSGRAGRREVGLGRQRLDQQLHGRGRLQGAADALVGRIAAADADVVDEGVPVLGEVLQVGDQHAVLDPARLAEGGALGRAAQHPAVVGGRGGDLADGGQHGAVEGAAAEHAGHAGGQGLARTELVKSRRAHAGRLHQGVGREPRQPVVAQESAVGALARGEAADLRAGGGDQVVVERRGRERAGQQRGEVGGEGGAHGVVLLPGQALRPGLGEPGLDLAALQGRPGAAAEHQVDAQ